MKEFLEFAKGEFIEAKWHEKIWTIFLVLCYIAALAMMVYFILFEPVMIIKIMFLVLWTALTFAVGVFVALLME